MATAGTKPERSNAPLALWLYRRNGATLAAAGLALGIGAATLAIPCHCDHPGLSAFRVGLVVLALLPWLLDLTSLEVPCLVSAAGVIAPVAVLTWGGGDSFALMLLSLLNGGVASSARPREVALVAAASVAVIMLGGNGPPNASWPYWVTAVVLGLSAGRLMYVQRTLLQRLEAAQAELRRAAVAEERTRIARDVHDVVAHSMTVTMLHVTAARMALESDPREAAEALEQAERTGRESLADIRRTVGLLRRGDEPDEPPAGATDLPALVEGYRTAGMRVELDLHGDVAAIPPAVGLALYRVAQESLANVAKHAPGARVRVELRVDARAARLLVASRGGHDGDAPAGSGSGIEGMRERAALLGGTLEAGPVDGGWEVRCVLSANAPPADPEPTEAMRTPADPEPTEAMRTPARGTS